MKKPTYLIAALMLATQMPVWAGKTLDQIRQKDQLTCGVNTGIAGFSAEIGRAHV